MTEAALIVGVGKGLGASLARRLSREGMHVALAARHPAKLDGLVRDTGARAYACDASQPAAVRQLFQRVKADLGGPRLVVFNAADRYRGPIESLEAERVRQCYEQTAFSGFLVAQCAARVMQEAGQGSLFFTGATASVKALAQSVPFAMAKFALRALAQSLARELAPQNIHVAHFVIDGSIGTARGSSADAGAADAELDPDAIAETCLHVHRQHRSAWTWEVELRPWVERF